MGMRYEGYCKPARRWGGADRKTDNVIYPFSVAMIKQPDKSDLQEKGFVLVWLTVQRYGSPC